MSAEYSHSHRDYSYKSSRRSDYRFNRYQPKEITIYEPKNPNKNTQYQDENDYDNYKSYDRYDSRSNYKGYKPKRYQKDTRTCNHGFNLWKTDFVVKSTNPPAAGNTETKDKEKEVVAKVMNESGSESDSLSSGKSTNIPTEGSLRSLDTLELNEDSQGIKEKVKGTIDEILEEREEGDNVFKSEVSQETDESDEEKFSNIDLKVEKKLRENEFDNHSDVFDDLYVEKRKTEEEEERPAWEDVDTKQILEDIKKGSDFLALYPQDIKASLKLASFVENEYKTEEVEDQQEEDDVEEDFNTILALRVLERGFSRPSIEVNTGAAFNNKNYQESAKSDVRLPIIIESPGVIGCQSAFLPSETPQYAYNNYPLTAQNYMFGVSGVSTPYTSRAPVQPVFKNFAEDYETNQWFYAGSDGMIQGPFSSRAMDEWYIQGYFPMELEVNLRGSRGFRTLRELVDIVNHGGDFLLNMNEVKDWFNHDEMKGEDKIEEESFPPGIPISPRRLLQNQRKECQSANLSGHVKRLAVFNVYNKNNNVGNNFKSSQSGNGSPSFSAGIQNHSSHNSPVNNSFNPSLPFPNHVNEAQKQETLDWKSSIPKDGKRKPLMMDY